MSAATPSPNKVNELAAATPVTQVPIGFVTEEILENLFYRFQGARPDLDGKLHEAFQKLYGVPMMELEAADRIHALYLEGPPGHGKTTAHIQACKRFCQAMRDVGVPMRFIEQPSMDLVASGKIDKNCFVFSTIELAGETSNKEFAGLMAKTKVNGREFMAHLPDWRLAATMMGGYGYVLFDDFVTASHQVQNATLGLLLGNGAGDLSFKVEDVTKFAPDGKGGFEMELKDAATLMAEAESPQRHTDASPVHFGLAGNRGVRDGNKVNPLTTATATRVMRYDVFDTVDDFCRRAFEGRTNAVNDMQVTAFLQANRDEFFRLAELDRGMLAQMPVPRTWDMFMTRMRTLASRHGGLSGISNMAPKNRDVVLHHIQSIAGACLGETTATKVAGFYNELFLGAAPEAEAIIKRGEVNVDKIRAKYNDGMDGDGMNFGYCLASALASYASSEISAVVGKPGKKELAALADVNSELSLKVRKTLMHFSYGLAQFSARQLATFSLSQFMSRLAVSVPQLFCPDGNFKPPTTETASLFITGLAVDNKKFPRPDFHETLLNAVSTWGVFNEDGFEDIIKKNKSATRAVVQAAGK